MIQSARFLALLVLFLAGCAPPAVVGNTVATPQATADLVPATQPVPSPLPSPSPPPSKTPTPDELATAAPIAASSPTSTASATPGQTATPLPTPGPSPTPSFWPTVTRQILPPEVAAGLAPCAQRTVPDDLLVLVSQQFGLPETYAPTDLVPLNDHFGGGVTVGLNNQMRQSILEPLRLIIDAMTTAGTHPSILSGYRSYGEQYLAWKWWNSQYPERVAIMSARAGHSEHQLGTTVDFGSPELDHLFHVDFANTAEGVWLRENAHRYGFTMSYPANSYEITGFKYEPWHYRYVGVELSTQLHESGQILTQWQLEHLPPPCIP